MLTEQLILPYLIERRVLSEKMVCAHAATVRQMPGRNCNYLVEFRCGAVFAKVATGPQSRINLAREDAIYTLFGIHVDRPVPYAIRRCDFDDEAGVLTLEGVRNARSTAREALPASFDALALGDRMGETLAWLHARFDLHMDRGLERSREPLLDVGPPGALTLGAPSLRAVQDMSAAALQLVEIVQSDSMLCDALAGIERTWRATTLVHNDVRFENWLCTRSVTAPPAVKLVDWELAGLGDPAWDLGCAFAEYVAAWLLSSPLGGGLSEAQVAALARWPLRDVRPCIAALWRAYVRERTLARSEAQQLLDESIRFLGVRLVHRAFERAQGLASIDAAVVCLVQLGANVLRRPGAAADELLRLRV